MRIGGTSGRSMFEVVQRRAKHKALFVALRKKWNDPPVMMTQWKLVAILPV